MTTKPLSVVLRTQSKVRTIDQARQAQLTARHIVRAIIDQQNKSN